MSVEFSRLFVRPSPDPSSALPAAGETPASGDVGEADAVSLAQVLDGIWGDLGAAGDRGGQTPPDGHVERPHVLLNMISTADGRATIGGRSGLLGGPADRALFHGLRSLVDAVLVGARTLRVEHYNRIIDDAGDRASRVGRGMSEEALACVVSGSLELDPTIPLLADAGAHVVMLTPSEATLDGVTAQMDYVRCVREGQLDLAAALRALGERFGVRTLLCEGGPHLAWQLVDAGLLDEMFLTLSPVVAGGDIASSPVGTRGMSSPEELAGGAALPLISGPLFTPPHGLELLSVLESDSYLFLRYRAAG